jgi:apolipoprotein N-acyltransferase
VAIGNFVLAALLYFLHGAVAGCGLSANAGWVAMELLRSFIFLAHWVAVSAYLYESSGLVQHLSQIGAFVLPVLCSVACWA